MKQILIALFSLASLTLAQAQITAPSGGNAAAADAKATTALSAANSATATANAALTAAGSVTATVATHTTQISSVSTAASSAITAASSATTAATAAQTTANTAISTANSATTSIGTLATQVSSVTGTANTALNTANTAITTANSATTALGSKQNTITTTTDITPRTVTINGALATNDSTLKAATTDFVKKNLIAAINSAVVQAVKRIQDSLSKYGTGFDVKQFIRVDTVSGTDSVSFIRIKSSILASGGGGGTGTVDVALSTSSGNAVANSAVTNAINANTATITANTTAIATNNTAINTIIQATLTPAITTFSVSNATSSGLTLNWSYTQKGVTVGDLLQLMPITVTTYQEAVALATGTMRRTIRVTSTHETYEYWPDSIATDKLELVVTN